MSGARESAPGGPIERVLEVLPDAGAVARRGAALVAVAARDAVSARERFTLAVSGGRTPWAMLGELARLDVPWGSVEVWQVDERIALEGDPDRNLSKLAMVLPADATLHPMPVSEEDLEAAAARYSASLPGTFDLVHLGLGDDGHTASLVPGDPVLGVEDRDVAITDVYRGRRRMTLTFRVLARARAVLWLVTGADKAAVLPLLLAGDPRVPAGRVGAPSQVVLADRAASAGTGS